MANYFLDNEDLLFYVDRFIDWETLVGLVEPRLGPGGELASVSDAKELYRDTLTMIGQLSAEEIAPRIPEIDRTPLRLEKGEVVHPRAFIEIFDQMKELELHSMCIPRALGGMNCPMMMYFLAGELIGRADVSVMAHFGFHQGMALALMYYAVLEGNADLDLESGELHSLRFRDIVEEIASGEAWGAMDITEANAGSDMAALRCKGEQDASGSWFVTGEKIFITSGHGKYHIVIARTEPKDDPKTEGLKGLSLFLVPAFDKDGQGRERRVVTISRLEEKLGHHGSPTVSVAFDRAPAELIGKRGEGFKGMLLLMNNARLGVGFECLGLLEAAHRMARTYASERTAFGKTLDRHEMIADYLDEMQTDIQALRALAVHGAFHEEVSRQLDFRLRYGQWRSNEEARIKERIRRHQWESRRVTPLVKYFGAEKAVEVSRRCLQIHGGVGYTTEYGAEKLVRDALVMPIYEGTSQIQALMAMKDTFADIMRRPRQFLARRAQARWRSLSSSDPLERSVASIESCCLSAQEHLLTRTVADKLRSLKRQPPGDWWKALRQNWDPKRDFARAMLHAERLIRLQCDSTMAEILAAQAKAHPERRELLSRFLSRAEPRARYLHDCITAGQDRFLEN
ncbi:MAG: acyl-CoA dehydrogenase family protein [Polyangia bacterium]|jgi:alkylation response protein AidB-like acyl-CoA dehydrogenase|nr:acyl-CoA dehydrogenase family protein [Polyangia bacterium]